MTGSGEGIPAVVAGTGHGLRVLVPALQASGFTVQGLVGNDAQRTARRADRRGIPHSFTDLDEAIRHTGAAAVAIATPPVTHAALVQIAARHGCHVLCEKPFARDAVEAAGMLAAVETAGVTHLMGNQFRMMPDRTVVARAIAQGLIGEPRLVSISQFVNYVADPSAVTPAWWFDREAGGGWLGASGSHMIDMIRTWLGDFASVSAKLLVVSDRDNVADDTYLARFTMQSGAEGVLMQTGGAWGDHSSLVRVAGTRGTLDVARGRVHLLDHNGSRELPIPAELALPPMPADADANNPYLQVELPPAIALCTAWHRAITGAEPGAVPVATFRDGLAAMQVMDAIRASASAAGEVVRVAVI